MKNIALLGSTGSIGTQTLDVVRASQDKFNIEVLAAGSSIGDIRKQIIEFSPSTVIMSDVRAANMLDEEFPTITVLSGPDALKESVVACDIVVNAIVGSLTTISQATTCLLYTSPSPRDYAASRMPSSA